MLKTAKYRVTLTLPLLVAITLFITSCVAENIAVPVAISEPTLLPQEKPVSVTTTTADAGHTLTPTPMATATPDPSPIPSTPTATFTPVPSPTVERLDWNFKIAFTSLQKRDDTLISELWVIELPEQEPRQLVAFRSAATRSDNRVSWSHDGRYVAYGHHTADNKVAVSIVDVGNSSVQQLGFSFPVDPFDTGNSSGINLSHDSWSLDDRWVQATLSYFKPDTSFPVEQDIFISTVDDQVIELDVQIEFVAWSKSVPDQFLYILHPDSETDYPTVHVGQIGLSEPVLSILNLEKYSPGVKFNIDWSPDNKRAIAISYDVATRNTSVVMIDLQQETWELLYEQQSYDELPFWSSDGRWVAMWHEDGLYLWEIDETEYPTTQISLQTELVTLLSWFPGKNWLVYQADDLLYAVDPELPDNLFEILDFNSLKVTSEQRIQASIWIPDQP